VVGWLGGWAGGKGRGGGRRARRKAAAVIFIALRRLRTDVDARCELLLSASLFIRGEVCTYNAREISWRGASPGFQSFDNAPQALQPIFKSKEQRERERERERERDEERRSASASFVRSLATSGERTCLILL
jgi:hypothetical protein